MLNRVCVHRKRTDKPSESAVASYMPHCNAFRKAGLFDAQFSHMLICGRTVPHVNLSTSLSSSLSLLQGGSYPPIQNELWLCSP